MVHLRKDSLKLARLLSYYFLKVSSVKGMQQIVLFYFTFVLFFSREKSAEKQNEMLDKYHTYFIFDADVDCAVRIFMMAREESDTENGIVYAT